MKTVSSYEIARIRAQRMASDAREAARQAEARERATTDALIVAVVLLTMAWVIGMVLAARHLLGVAS